MSKSIKFVFVLGLVASASACTYRVGGGAGAAGGYSAGAAVATEEFVIVEPTGLTTAPVIRGKYN